MSKVLVTGANGFIGLHLVRRLLEQFREVRCLVRSSSRLGELKSYPVEFAYGELGDAESLKKAVKGVTTIFHLAGATQVASSHLFYEVNAEGTANLARAASENADNPPRFVFVSSLAACGPARKREMQDETVFCRPVSEYGKSKLMAENELLAFSEKLPISIVRPPYVFGEGDNASVPLFRLIYRKRIHLIPGYFNSHYSFVHADDLARALSMVEEKGEFASSGSIAKSPEDKNPEIGRGIYFVAREERPRFGDFGRMIADSLGIGKIRVMKIPPMAVLVGGLANEAYKHIAGKTVAFDWNKARESLRGPWTCSEQKMRRQLGYVSPYSFHERLEQTSRWYLERFENETANSISIK